VCWAQETTNASVAVAPSLIGEITSAATATVAATVAAGAAVVMSADALITGTANAYVANQNDKATLSAVESQVAAENNAILHPPASTSQQGAVDTAPLQANKGGQGKGERNAAAKPDGTANAAKHAKPAPGKPGRWIVKDPHTGKESLKPPGWQP